jgi:hypothetical protein
MGKIKGSNPDPDNYRDGTGGAGNLIFYRYNGNNYVRTAPGETVEEILERQAGTKQKAVQCAK